MRNHDATTVFMGTYCIRKKVRIVSLRLAAVAWAMVAVAVQLAADEEHVQN